jgi:hypothetical protein
VPDTNSIQPTASKNTAGDLARRFIAPSLRTL